MDPRHPVFDLEIEAPDGGAALDLEHRLFHLTPTTIGRDGHWLVEVPAVRCPAEVEATVRQWLDEIGERATEIRVDGRAVRVTGGRASARSARGRGPNADFIG
jgi:hypothetical protein